MDAWVGPRSLGFTDVPWRTVEPSRLDRYAIGDWLEMKSMGAMDGAAYQAPPLSVSPFALVLRQPDPEAPPK